MITSLYAGLLGLLFIKISIDCIKGRKNNLISLGMGENNELEQLVSAHSNFTSYAIFLLFLTYLAEQTMLVPAIALHILAGAFTLGRLFHFIAFKNGKMNFKLRIKGMQLTIFPLLLLALLNIGLYIHIAFVK